MKLTVVSISLITLASCAAAPSPVVQEMTSAEHVNRMSLYVGQRDLDHHDYDPVDDQGTLGLEFAREPSGSPIGFEVGVMGSRDNEHDSGFDIKGRTSEVYAGLRKSFGSDVVRGYVGAGVSYIQSKIDVEGIGNGDDTSFAGYVHGGFTADLSTSMYLGLDLRFLFASDMTIAGVDTNADYGQLALILGFAF